METGLAEGSLENTRRNWELLATSCQQAGHDTRAIASLEKAVKALPEEGQLEFILAQVLYAGTRLDDARRHLESAVQKGRLDKPGQTRLFLAYAAYELHDHDSALRWVRDAAAFDDVKKEDAARLSKAIDEALRLRASAVSKS
jgi:tetratricopeptide (TPR) repeat protein